MTVSYLACIRLLVLVTTCFWLGGSPAYAEKTAQVVIISNSNDEPYQQATSGFKAQFPTNAKINFVELSLAEAKTRQFDIKLVKPDLIYSLGVESTEWASLQTTSVPIVATLVLKDDLFKKAKNITGISLNYPLKTQFQWLRKFFSQQKTVAILYNPTENAKAIEAARDISQQNGFKLNSIAVDSPKELPFALEQLDNNIDILLAIPDETVMSVNTAKEVLLASFRNKVPLIGLSDNWVKSGAFYALSWDYGDLGHQCAVMAQKLLAGATIANVPPENPRKTTYTVNAKIAEHMNMEIPAELLKNAKKIFD